ncbi:HK97 family phage prohead protease [Amycolatopsis sp. cg5]|uniref:HK97 family phage prohead protease n=1 Tax=Amycolatopsis sp. cg5 TaxID=3238802 RepID=UPI003525CEBA
MKVKTCPVLIKAAGTQDGTDDGVFEAIVAAYNVDSVGDKIVPGAFAETLDEWKNSGSPIPVLWSHMSHDPDYHIGYVEEAEEREEGLWVRARIDLDEPKAKKVYKLLKGKRVRQFSFAYDVQEGGWVDEKSADDDAAGDGYFELRKLRLYEVGPTLIGANQETELLSVKSAIGAHSTATDDGTWDGPANEARLSNDAGKDTYRKAFAWQDPDGDPDAKSSYKFIHHNVSTEGEVGAANLQACTTGIAVLNGSRTGTTIPDDDRQGVYNHLARHLRDADVEPPELKSEPTTDPAEPAQPEDKEGRAISAKDEDTLRGALATITDSIAVIEGVLSGSDSDDDTKATPAEPATNDEKSASPARPADRPDRLRIWMASLNGEVNPDSLTA